MQTSRFIVHRGCSCYVTNGTTDIIVVGEEEEDWILEFFLGGTVPQLGTMVIFQSLIPLYSEMPCIENAICGSA